VSLVPTPGHARWRPHVPGRDRLLRGTVGRASQLDARTHAELGVDVAQVSLDGPSAQDELLGDLAVRAAGDDEVDDLAFASGQGAGGRVASPAHDPVAEAPQLAYRLVAAAQRAEAVERLLRGGQRLDGGRAVTGCGARAALREQGACAGERCAGGGFARGGG
jgi:hypothetical protein